ncbi:hypothetical protein [Nocardia sp. NPDC056000]|uniref:hypothetical protein n=1 Tax=Nocardia sp. NPDC056000 TaxID=3345674 RepID=UPI0035D83243
MNRRARLSVAVASMVPMGLGVLICCLLVAAGTEPAGVVSALALAAVIMGIFTYFRLRRTPPTRRGRTSAENSNP